jgi:hypothetical protein
MDVCRSTKSLDWLVFRMFYHYLNVINKISNDKVYQLLAHGRWFSPGTPASSTTTTVRHDIAETLLKVALKLDVQ